MIILTFTAVGILQSIDEPSCIYHSDCHNGYWCSAIEGHCEQCFAQFAEKCTEPNNASFLTMPSSMQPSRMRGTHRRTVAYLYRTPDEGRGDKLAFGDYFQEEELGNMCKGCYSEKDSAFVSSVGMGKLHIQTMRRSDWAAVFVAAFVVVLSVLKELRHIQLLELAWREKGAELGVGWNSAIWILTSLRHFAFLPAILCTVPTMIITTGGNALNICVDSVGILFVLELDVFMVLLFVDDQEVPSLCQQVSAAMKKREGPWSHSLDMAHLFAFFMAVGLQVKTLLWANTMHEYGRGYVAIPLAFLLAAFISVTVKPPLGSRCGALASVFAQWFVGMAWFLLMMVASNQDRAKVIEYFGSQIRTIFNL